MAVKLTEGAIPMISRGEMQQTATKPLLQVLVLHDFITSKGMKNLCQLLLSDGSFHERAVLVAEPRPERLKVHSIVRLKEYVAFACKNTINIRVFDLEVVDENCDLIGDPRMCPVRRPPVSDKPPMPAPIIHPNPTTTEKIKDGCALSTFPKKS